MSIDLTYGIEMPLHDFLDLFPEVGWRDHGEEYILTDGGNLVRVEFRQTNSDECPRVLAPEPALDTPEAAEERRKRLMEFLDLTDSDPKRASGGM